MSLTLNHAGLGASNAIQTCHQLSGGSNVEGISLDSPLLGIGTASFAGALFEGLSLGIAACALSLGTNLFTTLLVAYKAWYVPYIVAGNAVSDNGILRESRRRLQGYFVAKVGGSQVEKLLALLIESGAIYSAIWVSYAGR